MEAGDEITKDPSTEILVVLKTMEQKFTQLSKGILQKGKFI